IVFRDLVITSRPPPHSLFPSTTLFRSQPLITASRQVVEQTFPAGFFVRLDGLLGKYMTNLQCSDDCLKVARAILKALKDAEDEGSEEHTSELQSRENLVCRLLLEKKN